MIFWSDDNLSVNFINLMFAEKVFFEKIKPHWHNIDSMFLQYLRNLIERKPFLEKATECLHGVCVSTMLARKSAGDYTLRIRNTNYRSMLELRLDSVDVYRLGGIDVDNNGLADWLEQRYG